MAFFPVFFFFVGSSSSEISPPFCFFVFVFAFVVSTFVKIFSLSFFSSSSLFFGQLVAKSCFCEESVRAIYRALFFLSKRIFFSLLLP